MTTWDPPPAHVLGWEISLTTKTRGLQWIALSFTQSEPIVPTVVYLKWSAWNWMQQVNPTHINLLGFPGGSVVKNSPAMQEMQETWVWSLGREDPLEEEMATYSSILARKIPWTEEPGRLQSMESQRIRHDWAKYSAYLSPASKHRLLGFHGQSFLLKCYKVSILDPNPPCTWPH